MTSARGLRVLGNFFTFTLLLERVETHNYFIIQYDIEYIIIVFAEEYKTKVLYGLSRRFPNIFFKKSHAQIG